ncbi:MAG: hypothetical protein GXY33_08380 [Phycisphaerae bacterium]|nr:hypothetical protein [Phycisphaerae bacterium]
MVVRRALTTAGVLGALWMAGCAPQRPFEPLSTAEAVTRAERELQPLRSFRSKGGNLGVLLTDEKGSHRFPLGGLNVLFDGPKSLYLSASVPGTPAALLIGSNEEQYWLGIKPQVSTLWWGRWKYVDQPCNEWRLAAPNRLVEALGQVNIRDLSGQYLGPVVQNRKPFHVLMYLAVDDEGFWYIAREIYLDPNDRLSVAKIMYLDPQGQADMEMRFADYRFVEDGEHQGYVPERIELYWPKDKSHMKLKLGPIEAREEFHPRAFQMPDKTLYERAEQVDIECGNE